MSFLATHDSVGLEDVLSKKFYSKEENQNLLDRNREKAIWIKIPYRVEKKNVLIFDFVRQDFVNFYLFAGDSLVDQSKTGFLLKSSEKTMHYWNAIDMTFEPGVDYTIYIRLENHINEPSIHFNVDRIVEWRESLLYRIIVDIVFLSLILAISLYTLLIYFQNKEKSFLFFALYLMSIFGFYLYILDILRDFIIRENPLLTSYFIGLVLLAASFYLGFMSHFLNTKKIIPKYHGFMRLFGNLNLVLFLLFMLYYMITGDYYGLSDTTRGVTFFNVLLGMFFTYQLWLKRNELVIYFIAGSAVMMVGALIDIIYWTSSETLGEVARVGFIIEIFLFSLGLGKKSQIAEQEKEIAQRAYIEQLEINKRQTADQKLKLEKKVADRTKAFKQAKEEAEKNAKAKEEFLSIMSHEIRTPMNAIVGLTHMLTSEAHDDEFDENLTTLKYSVDNLILLVNNILDYNKISGGNVQLEHVSFNLRKIVHSISHLFKAKADSKGLVFDVYLDSEIPNHLIGDPFRLSQVLNNFLSNAIKFTERGRISLNVSVDQTVDGKAYMKFVIEDTGIGIPLDKQIAIFDSFTQAGMDTARKFGGTGLGLAISKDLIELMQGSMSVESTELSGSTFTFTIPFEVSENELNESNSGVGFGGTNVNIDDLTILIVDDNQMNRIILKKFLDKWGVSNQLAVNGLDAIKKLNETRFDLVLLDLQMPEMDGYQVATIMRHDQSLFSIPIIAISADTISNVHDQVIAAGMDDFVAKPFNPDDLKAKIYTLTSRFRN